MYGYIYLTTNLINNKKYIGQHKAKRFSTNYIGSGMLIKQAIKKYGKHNFHTELLCECYSFDELNEKEVFYINLYNAVNDDNFYNISKGGSGFDELCIRKMSDSAKSHENNTKDTKWMFDGHSYTRVRIELVDEYKSNGWIEKGPDRSEESKQRYSMGRKGLITYTDGNTTVYIKEDQIPEYESLGFVFGRVPSTKKGTKRYAWMNNGVDSVYIKFDQVEQYERMGYTHGMVKTNSKRPYNRKSDKPVHNKGKIQVKRDGVIKHIYKEELEAYINDGYEKVKKD